MEQTEGQVSVSVQIIPAGRPLSDQVRASLEAVRVAREAAFVRARRQTVRTRLWFVALVGAAALATVTVGPRILRFRQAGKPAAAPARASSPPALPAPPAPAPAIAPPAATMAIAEPAATPARKPDAPDRAATEVSPAAAPAKARGAATDQTCDTGLIRKAPWLLSPEACAVAFDADPNNASLALGIAHAEHVRGHGTETAQWAQRALSLDPNAAEAYVLIARSEADAGHADEARAAYARYLELAPRGWHKAEAQTGVRLRHARP